ncbi:hypothetical protein ACFQL1_16055 [Halomicroarcula sp. GCM10025709]|uniref:hypothetical protein n=1 Tax=Haloarcula TaxID=2237 RepID=UPI0024C407F1|nr:hypothetical protein [Halomicroarcula sp. YJ-61-S]
MANLTREERRARIERDDGALDDDVHHSATTSRGDICYHDDEDCHNLLRADSIETVTRAEAHRRLWPACRLCVLDDADDRNKGPQQASLRHTTDDVDYEFEWDKRHAGGDA